MWHMIRDGGGPAIFAAFLGVIGALLGVVAASMLGISRRSAFVLGWITLSFAIVVGGLGAFGVVKGRHMTDEALEYGAIDAVQAERIRDEGYSEAAASGRVGALFGVLPLLLGAAAAFGGAGASVQGGGAGAGAGAMTSMPPGYGPGIYANVPNAFGPPPKAGAGRWVVAGVLTAVAALCLLGALGGGMSAPYPNPNETSYDYE